MTVLRNCRKGKNCHGIADNVSKSNTLFLIFPRGKFSNSSYINSTSIFV